MPQEAADIPKKPESKDIFREKTAFTIIPGNR
jgi:hypothetical protein